MNSISPSRSLSRATTGRASSRPVRRPFQAVSQSLTRYATGRSMVRATALKSATAKPLA